MHLVCHKAQRNRLVELYISIGYSNAMTATKYRINLTLEERENLQAIRDKGNHKAYKYKRAQALLLSDESEGKGLTDKEIQLASGMKIQTIEKLRKRCHKVGALKALERVPRSTPAVEAKITGEVEAHITQIACSEAPDGRSRWTLQLIADEVVARGVLCSLSHTSVGTVLKKVTLSRGNEKDGA